MEGAGEGEMLRFVKASLMLGRGECCRSEDPVCDGERKGFLEVEAIFD